MPPKLRRVFDRLLPPIWAVFLFNALVVNPYLVSRSVTADSNSPIAKGLYWYGTHVDPLSLELPPWLGFSLSAGTLFAAYFVAAAYAFHKRCEWIRPWTMLWAGAVVFEVAQFLVVSLVDPLPGTNVAGLLSINLPWLFLPVALVWRVWEIPVFESQGARAGLTAEGVLDAWSRAE
jgi:hypothetical protein